MFPKLSEARNAHTWAWIFVIIFNCCICWKWARRGKNSCVEITFNLFSLALAQVMEFIVADLCINTHTHECTELRLILLANELTHAHTSTHRNFLIGKMCSCWSSPVGPSGHQACCVSSQETPELTGFKRNISFCTRWVTAPFSAANQTLTVSFIPTIQTLLHRVFEQSPRLLHLHTVCNSILTVASAQTYRATVP